MKHVIALAVSTLLMLMAFMASAYTEVDTVKDSVAAVSVDMDVGTVQQEGTCQLDSEWSYEMNFTYENDVAVAVEVESPAQSNVHGAYEKDVIDSSRRTIVIQTFSVSAHGLFSCDDKKPAEYTRTWDVIAWTSRMHC